jgi:RNA recognition motif-containing protein
MDAFGVTYDDESQQPPVESSTPVEQQHEVKEESQAAAETPEEPQAPAAVPQPQEDFRPPPSADDVLVPGKLFVGGVSWETSDEGLKNYFANYGAVLDACLMKDKYTSQPRGFGFVTFQDEQGM